MALAARRSLATKLILIGAVTLLVALSSIGLTLWISWHLEGGAAAVNEAGRLRMQTYRIALALADTPWPRLQSRFDAFDASLDLLRRGDPARPLFVPWDNDSRAAFDAVERGWVATRASWADPALPEGSALARADEVVTDIDGFVGLVEARLSLWTSVLHGVQLAVLGLAIAGAVALVYAGYLFVLNPVQRLHRGLQRIAGNDFDARVDVAGNDEFAELADGFNHMAEHLGLAYRELEARVLEKTGGLERERARLAALYEVSSFVSQATTVAELAQGVARLIRRIARADAVALRWSDAGQERYLLLASDALPEGMTDAEQCLHAARCHCGSPVAGLPVRVIPIRHAAAPTLGHCEQAGYATLVSVAMTSQHRNLGEIDLFYADEVAPGAADRSLYEALAQHLAAAMEGLRVAALAREAAVSDERAFIARELHDSIAQSLAFLKMQVPLLRSALGRADLGAIARVTEEIDAGVRESNADVRELLLHFRTRANADDIAVALRTTLQKFEHQTGIQTTLQISGDAVQLDPDVQVQVLHVIQEALSNVRKHAGASHVWLDVQQAPRWRFSVRDNGRGFDAGADAPDATHVGLAIMRERAARIGAAVELSAVAGEGSRVVLTLAGQAAAGQFPRADGAIA